jgi:hypothetical protein
LIRLFGGLRNGDPTPAYIPASDIGARLRRSLKSFWREEFKSAGFSELAMLVIGGIKSMMEN